MLYNRPFAKLGLKDQLRHIAMRRKKKINNANDSSVKFKILIPDEPLIQL